MVKEIEKIRISEIFRSLEGEGQFAGTPTIFIRTSGCNLKCRWCDTRYTEVGCSDMSPRAIYIEVQKLLKVYPKTPRISITGGEPLLWDDRLSGLINLLRMESGKQIHFETNCTMMPSFKILDQRMFFTVSPKLPSSGSRWEDKVLWYWKGRRNVEFKFVVADQRDWNTLMEMYRTYTLQDEVVYVQPCYEPPHTHSLPYQQRMQRLADRVLNCEYNIRIMPQLHKLFWPEKERGV